jgi:CHAT domain-containing protein
VLGGGDVLTLDDVYRLAVPADLAVLSACETGRGSVVRGEGVVGLVRGFFFAGAPSVVVSNWKVPDESTRALMVSFYEKMIVGGRPPGAALRAAKLERLSAGGARSAPHDWASFVLWGTAE